jgi:hypothetical protein
MLRRSPNAHLSHHTHDAVTIIPRQLLAMSLQAQAEFLFAVIKHIPAKVNTRHLAAALNLTVSAATMRMTRLKRKLAQSVGGPKSVREDELDFLLKVVELSGGKTDWKALESELGLKESAARMRLTRLRKKFAQNTGTHSGDSGIEAEVVPMDDGDVKHEAGVIEVKYEENW